jgi:hypothetical protein
LDYVAARAELRARIMQDIELLGSWKGDIDVHVGEEGSVTVRYLDVARIHSIADKILEELEVALGAVEDVLRALGIVIDV